MEGCTTCCDQAARFGWKTPISISLGLSLSFEMVRLSREHLSKLLLEGVGLADIIHGERGPQYPVHIHSLNLPFVSR